MAQFGLQLGIELYAQAVSGSPAHVTRRLYVIDLDHQHELVRNTDLARHFQACADRRQMSYAAVEAADAVEHDGPHFQRAVALNLSSLLHDTLRRYRHSCSRFD